MLNYDGLTEEEYYFYEFEEMLAKSMNEDKLVSNE